MTTSQEHESRSTGLNGLGDTPRTPVFRKFVGLLLTLSTSLDP
jgi:hypothetical protein